MCRTCQRSWDPTHDRYQDTEGKLRENAQEEDDDRQEQGANAQNEEAKGRSPVKKAQVAPQAAQEAGVVKEIIKNLC